MLQLTPVERLAVAFIEAQIAPFNAEELQKAEVCAVIFSVMCLRDIWLGCHTLCLAMNQGIP